MGSVIRSDSSYYLMYGQSHCPADHPFHVPQALSGPSAKEGCRSIYPQKKLYARMVIVLCQLSAMMCQLMCQLMCHLSALMCTAMNAI